MPDRVIAPTPEIARSTTSISVLATVPHDPLSSPLPGFDRPLLFVNVVGIAYPYSVVSVQVFPVLGVALVYTAVCVGARLVHAPVTDASIVTTPDHTTIDDRKNVA